MLGVSWQLLIAVAVLVAFVWSQSALAKRTSEHNVVGASVGLLLAFCSFCGMVFLTGFLGYSWWENGFLYALALFISMMAGGLLGGTLVAFLGVQVMGLAGLAAIPICIYVIITL